MVTDRSLDVRRPAQPLRLARELAGDALALAPQLPGVVLARGQTAALLEQLG